MVSVDKYVILYKSLATLVFDNTNYNRNEGLKMGWIITLIVGAIIGIIASSITGKNFPGWYVWKYNCWFTRSLVR